MEPENSLPCSQEAATSPYPQPDESNPHISNLTSYITNYMVKSPS
jgi:hypothetical protein